MYDKLGYILYRAVKAFGRVIVTDTAGVVLIEYKDFNYYWSCEYDAITDSYVVKVYQNKEKREAVDEFIY